MLHLGLANSAAMFAEAQATPDFLSDSEISRLAQISRIDQRARFWATRYLLRKLLILGWGGEPHDWSLTAQAGQAVKVNARPELYLSLSHSGDYLLAAAADVPVGVDVERCRPKRSSLAMAELVCHASEHEQLSQLDLAGADQTFLRYWTQKEAWLKCNGLGLDWALMARLCLHPTASHAADTFSWQGPDLVCSLVTMQAPELHCHWWTDCAPTLQDQGCMRVCS